MNLAFDYPVQYLCWTQEQYLWKIIISDVLSWASDLWPTQAQLNDSPGVGLSQAWELEKPKLEPWPRPGCLFPCIPTKNGCRYVAVPHVYKPFYQTGAISISRHSLITCMTIRIFKQLYYLNLVIFSTVTISISLTMEQNLFANDYWSDTRSISGIHAG